MSSKIEWTEYNWEVTGGCDKVSSGCRGCYAINLINRFSRNPIFNGRYDGLVENNNWTGKIKLFEDRLEQPLRWKKPRKVFVNSRSDLFHEDVPDEFIGRVFATMAMANQHIFQILTKRPERMLSLPAQIITKNIWLGVSVEDQETANERIQLLLQTPAAVRWISCEPLLGEIDLIPNWMEDKEKGLLDWIVCGGESGPKGRPMHPDWVRSIKDQCQASSVPFFFKQWGNFIPLDYIPTYKDKDLNKIYAIDEYGVLSSASFIFAKLRVSFHRSKKDEIKKYMWVKKLGKKKAGNLLDNKQYLEYPKGE